MFHLRLKRSRSTDLERALGLRFKDGRLLEQALAHPSYLNENLEYTLGSYQRLEFLGDAVLQLAITGELYRRCPGMDEGQLTRLRSFLVKGTRLALVAREMELGQHLSLGRGEEANKGRDKESILAAALEALIGSVFVDRGYQVARKYVLKIMGKDLDDLLRGEVPEDPKSRLQHLSQVRGWGRPQYRTVRARGPNHARSFKVEVLVHGEVVGHGTGVRKAEAESEAAEQGIRHLDASR